MAVRDLTPDQNDRLRPIVQDLADKAGGRTALAKKMGVSQPAISQFLNGENGMNRGNAEKVAQFLGRSFEDVVGPPGEPRKATQRRDPESDARQWFLHRVEHDAPERLDAAREWLETSAPPYSGRPVPWNNTLVDRFNAWWSARSAQLPTPKGPAEAPNAGEPQTVLDASAIEHARVAWLKKTPPKARAERETWSTGYKLAAKGAVSEEQLIAMWDRAWLEHAGRAAPDRREDKMGGVRERQARLEGLRGTKGVGGPKP